MKLSINVGIASIGIVCGVTHASTPPIGPLLIMNNASPLGQPKYQLAAYTGSLNPPVLTQISQLNVSTRSMSDLVSSGGNAAPRMINVMNSQANTPFYGFLSGSLVANGYMATPIVSSAVTASANSPAAQPFSLGVSSAFSIGNSNANSSQTHNVGLTDIAELCQRYGAMTGVVSVPGYAYGGGFNVWQWPSTNGPSFEAITLPYTQAVAAIEPSMRWMLQPLALAEFLIANPIVIANKGLYWPVTYWNYSGSGPTTLNSLSFIPLVMMYSQVNNVSTWLNQTITEDNLVQWSSCWTTIQSANTYLNFNALSCETPSVKNTAQQLITVVQNPLPLFNTLHNWFVNNVGIQFAAANTVSSTAITSVMTMYGANANSPITSAKTGSSYNQAYATLLTKLGTPAVSATLNPATITSVAVPSAGSTGSAMTTEYFDALGVYIPLLMADPCNNIQANPKLTGSPYFYPGMVVNTWVEQNNQWVMGNGATQQINYSGGQAASEFGQAQQVTDFDPRKSMMSDYYNLLSY